MGLNMIIRLILCARVAIIFRSIVNGKFKFTPLSSRRSVVCLISSSFTIMVFLCFLLFSLFQPLCLYYRKISASYNFMKTKACTIATSKENYEKKTNEHDAYRASQYKWFRIESMWLAMVALVNAKAVVRSIAIRSLLHITWLYIKSHSSMVNATNVDTRHEYKSMNIHDNTLKYSNNNNKTVRKPWQSHKILKQWKKLW